MFQQNHTQVDGNVIKKNQPIKKNVYPQVFFSRFFFHEMEALTRFGIEKGFEILSRESCGDVVTAAQALDRLENEKTQEEAFPFLCVAWTIMEQPQWSQEFDARTGAGTTKLFQELIISNWRALPSKTQ